MRLKRTSVSSTPNSGVIFAARSRMRCAILSRPVAIEATGSAPVPVPCSSSIVANERLLERTISMRSKDATALRVSPSTMSSSRLWAPRSSCTAWKKRRVSLIRHRA